MVEVEIIHGPLLVPHKSSMFLSVALMLPRPKTFSEKVSLANPTPSA